MALQSNFKSDLEKEKKLSVLLNTYYKRHLKHYDFTRVQDIKRQLLGIDLLLKHKSNGEVYAVDEKAQLDYVNEDLPTFAFEISFLKRGIPKKGWLFDTSKKTDFYALITGIFCDEPSNYTSCKITWVNRKKLVDFLKTRDIAPNTLESYTKKSGKIEIEELDHRSEGYLYFSSNTKAEKPLNLILKLDFLLQHGIAKRLV